MHSIRGQYSFNFMTSKDKKSPAFYLGHYNTEQEAGLAIETYKKQFPFLSPRIEEETGI